MVRETQGVGAWVAGPDSGMWPDGDPDADGRGRCPRCAAELARPFTPADIADRRQLARPEDAAEIVVPELAGRDRERCVAAFLDTKHRLLATATVSVGSVDHTFMGPREIYRDALGANAAAFVLAHNHPSGDPEPSRDDERVTRRIGEAGRLLGVDLLDHLIVGGCRWVSLARRGVV